MTESSHSTALLIDGWPPEKKATKTSTCYKQITQPWPGLFSVRINEKKKADGGIAKSFSKQEFGSSKEALRQALIFRDSRSSDFQKEPNWALDRCSKRDRSKFSTNVLGVSRCYQIRESPTEGAICYVYYSVRYFVRDPAGETRYKSVSFWVGRNDGISKGQYQHGFLTACYVRQVFLDSIAPGAKKPFSTRAFKEWRKVAYYLDGQPPVDYSKL